MIKITKFAVIILALSLIIACKTQTSKESPDTLSTGFEFEGDQIKFDKDEMPASWITDYTKAKEYAKKTGKTILINFTGSDWCIWCKRLDREVFKQKAFMDYAKEKLILLKVDFPKNIPQTPEEKQTNEKLANQYMVKGFPTIILINSEGTEIGRMGYEPGGAEKYVESLKSYIK